MNLQFVKKNKNKNNKLLVGVLDIGDGGGRHKQ
jgi:hypothetical protein